jgi:hypothetical protein
MLREKIYVNRYLAGRVKRYSTWPMLTTQTVAEHCWRVACIYVEIFGMPRAEVLYYCLHHDSGELWAGDLPFGVKIAVPGLSEAMRKAEAEGLQLLDLKLPQLTPEETTKCKICDLLEMNEHGKHEMTMGNEYAEPIVHDTLAEAQRQASMIDASDKVNHWVMRNRYD